MIEEVVLKALQTSLSPIVDELLKQVKEVTTKPYLTLGEAAARVGCSESQFLKTYAKTEEVKRTMRKAPTETADGQLRRGRRTMYLTESFDQAIIEVLERIN